MKKTSWWSDTLRVWVQYLAAAIAMFPATLSSAYFKAKLSAPDASNATLAFVVAVGAIAWYACGYALRRTPIPIPSPAPVTTVQRRVASPVVTACANVAIMLPTMGQAPALATAAATVYILASVPTPEYGKAPATAGLPLNFKREDHATAH